MMFFKRSARKDDSVRKPVSLRDFRRLIAIVAAFLIAFLGARSFMMSIATNNLVPADNVKLGVFVRNSHGAVESRSNNQYHSNEQLYLTYSCSVFKYLILFSIDSNKAVRTYYPVAGDSSIELQKGNGIPLPDPISLSQMAGNHIFVAVFSRKPLLVASVQNETLLAIKNISTIPDRHKILPAKDRTMRLIRINVN